MARLAYFFLLLATSFAAMLREHWVRATWRTRGVRIARRVTFVAHASSAVTLAHGVSVGLGTVLLSTIEKSELPPAASFLRIGTHSAVNEYCNIRACGGSIEIGAKCIVAQMVTIVASNHSTQPGEAMIDQPWSESPIAVTIGNDVWIGAGATILPGTSIADGAVIAAGAVVRGHVPPGEIWGGVPARRLKGRSQSTTIPFAR